ncbi:MAG TPA: zf-HC2 domain-containing protein [Blastocatellia bacterium]|nr:zf-HC2 domain-containing protein [Blastocatellia bacterium]
MISAHLSENEIDRYRKRVMAASELFAASDHLSLCDDCYDRFTSGDDLDAEHSFILSQVNEAVTEVADHLRYEEMVAYVNGEMDEADTEVLRDHLEECVRCDSDVADLRLFKSTIGGAHDAKPVTRSLSGNWYREKTFQVPLAAAATVFIVLGAVWFASARLRTRVDGLQAEVAQIRGANETLREQLAQEIQSHNSESFATSVNPASSAAIVLKDGAANISFDGAGTLTGVEVPQQYAGLVESALRTGRLPLPAGLFREEGAGAARAATGSGEAFHLIAPAATTIASNQPTFRWTPMDGATRYIVFVRDKDSDEQIESPPLTSAEWTPDKPLAGGRTYSWSVEALIDGKRYYSPSAESPRVLFKVLAPGKAETLDRARKSTGNSHLVMGVLYAREGLFAEARKELKALQAENPNSSQVTSLIESLRRTSH